MCPLSCVFLGLLACAAGPADPRDLAQTNPPFPRIGTCYGAGLSWKTWDQGAGWWSKLGLIIGGGYDLHYDWEQPRWPKALANLETNLTKLREVNPHCLYLPYVDVVEGPDNPNLPSAWWDLRDGQRWSGWPGYLRINTKLPEVLQFNLDKTRDEILARAWFDGVFYDCWSADDWLVPRTAELRQGKAVVMINDWNLPARGFEHLNGCLAEDELNRIVEGKVDFEEFLGRYLRWCSASRKPLTTMLVCHPRPAVEDPWGNAKRTHQERLALIEKVRLADPQMLRFGLTTALLGDGYFGYDGGNGLSRGNWWWYPEYDAPLRYPRGPAQRRDDGLWERPFEGGLVITNGTVYDAAVELPTRCRDVSTGRIGTRFTIPRFDGRILLPATEAATPGEDVAPRLTRTPPATPQALRLDHTSLVARTPGGIELWFDTSGETRHIRCGGQALMTGGWPGIYNHPMNRYEPREVAEPELTNDGNTARLVFRGTLTSDAQRVGYTAACTVGPGPRFGWRYDFTLDTDLNLRMWRHFLAFPVRHYAEATAAAAGRSVVLPTDLGEASLLPASQQVVIETESRRLTISSTVPLALVDHRKWGTNEYLLAGYPLRGEVRAGTELAVELSVTVEDRR